MKYNCPMIVVSDMEKTVDKIEKISYNKTVKSIRKPIIVAFL